MKKQKLLDLKQEIEEAKEKVSELKGEKQSLYKRLKQEFQCDSLDVAKEKQEELQEEINKINDKIEKAVTELKEKYEIEEE